MDPIERTPEGMDVLYEASTGRRRRFWPVDARDHLASGDYTAVPPGGAAYEAADDIATVDATSLVSGSPDEYAPGVPLKLTRSHDAPPAQPMQAPVRTHRKGRR